MNKQEPNPIKGEIKQLTAERVRHYRNQEGRIKELMRQNPKYPTKSKKKNKKIVIAELAKIRKLFSEVFPYIKEIKEHVPSITNQDRLTAVYILFGKVSQGLQAIFTLAEKGLHQEVMELIRSNREALDLIVLFLEGDESNSDLRKWFDGEIVGNQKGRAAVNKLINEVAQKAGIELSDDLLKSGIYKALSAYTHVSYAALLDSLDVFNRDFDFEKISGYHYVKESSLPYIQVEIEGIIIALKHFYLVVGDNESYLELDKILKRHRPDLYDKNSNADVVKSIFKKFKK